jgi:hypothetical protein
VSNDISSANQTNEDDRVAVADKVETISSILFNTVKLIEKHKITFELFLKYFRMKMKIIQ